MKRLIKKTQNVVKGMPTAVVVSILIHVGLFFGATVLVIFKFRPPPPVKFEPPPPVKVPKMPLKKLQVKMKKPSKPKASAKITAVVPKLDLHEIAFPDLASSGIGAGLGAGSDVVGFADMPDLDEMMSPFGGQFTTGSDLKGFFYNFNRNRAGLLRSMTPEAFHSIMQKYMKRGWSSSVLAPYYRSPEPLYSSTICIPSVMSEMAPEAFGETSAEGYCWAVIYEGKIVYPEDITFRFWGVGDKFSAIQVDGKTVLICAFRPSTRDLFSNIWYSNDPNNFAYYFAESRAQPSDWITLKAGEPKDIQVLVADAEGGLVTHILSVEVKGETYPRDRTGGGPTFPVFKTAELTRDKLDLLYPGIYLGDMSFTNGPVFCDYGDAPAGSTDVVAADSSPSPIVEKPEPDDKMREWTVINGETLKAEFVIVMGDQTVLKTGKGKTKKIPLDQLSQGDLEYIDLERPLKLSIDFLKKSTQVPNPPLSPFLSGIQRPLKRFNFVFGARVKQTMARKYSHELTVEYFAVGKESDGDRYILLERNKDAYIPTEENKRSFEFRGGQILLRQMALRDSAPMRGIAYDSFLVTVTDERGKIIAHKASSKFLFENIEKLKQLSPHNYFDRDCARVLPTPITEAGRGFYAINPL